MSGGEKPRGGFTVKFGACDWDAFIADNPRVSDEIFHYIDACQVCKGRLQIVVMRSEPLLMVSCEACSLVFVAFKLKRGDKVA